MTNTENYTPEVNYKQDMYYSYAFEIIKGHGGGEYIYSLQEDYIYSYENGVWKQIFDIEFLDRVEIALPEITKFPLPARKQILDNFKHKKYLRLEEFNQKHLINLENYMFDPLGINVLAHSKDFYSNVRIPYKYDQALGCQLWEKTLEEILEGDKLKIGLLQEFFGYCLTKDTKQHKALLLLGESRSGKSTILQTLRELIGTKNCSSVPLKYINNPQYTPMLINKLVNIDSDVSAKASEFEAEFKTITSGEPVSCNQKFIATFEFVPYCKIVMAANIFPRITDHSSAFYKRLLLIPCDRVFSEEEQNKNLIGELKKELPGILNWAIKGLKNLTKRGRFEELDFISQAVKELEYDNNPAYIFFDEHIEVCKNNEIEKGELYEKYKIWSEKNKMYPLSSNRFSTCIYKKYKSETPKDTQNPNTRKRIWRNIKYVHFKDDTKEQVSWDPATGSNISDAKVVNPVRIGTGPENLEEINWEK